MKTTQGIAYAREMMGMSSKLLAPMVVDIYEKHQANSRLTDKEIFLIGLCYSEFLADSNSEGDLFKAGMQRDGFCELLGIDGWELQQTVEIMFRR